YGDAQAPGVLSRTLDALASVAPGMASRLASQVFDVNFYPQGFLHDGDSPLLTSPFHTITRDGGLVKIELDRGASLLKLLNTSDALLRDLTALGAKLESVASPVALDYALCRSLNNTHREAAKIVEILEDGPADAAGTTALSELRAALAAVAAPEPLNRLGGGLMKPQERWAMLDSASALRKAIDAVAACALASDGVPIVQKARQSLEAEYAEKLANIKHRRDIVMTDAIERRPVDARSLIDVTDDELCDELDQLALHAYDLQIAYACEANDAYLSAAAVHLTVAGQQLHRPQTRDATVAANAVAENVGMTAAHAPRVEPTSTRADNPNETRRALGEYLVHAAKYITRALVAARAVNPERWDSNFAQRGFNVGGPRRLTHIELLRFGTALRDAKAKKSPAAAIEAARRVGLHNVRDVRMFTLRVLLYARRAELHALESANPRVGAAGRMGLPPTWPIVDWAIGKVLGHLGSGR
ncbi:MAG TPA: hypothetical protein VFH51_14205, partial [Myxococcota bacterium]|nr:hypothetical protein [Myxococcota bacterium]